MVQPHFAKNRLFMEIEVVEANGRTEQLVAGLVALWERSVRASHHFLTDGDIIGLLPIVRQELAEIPTLAVATDAGQRVGFIGIAGRKTEMLFVEPSHMGQGVGHRLVEWGVGSCGANLIDVNEQNPHAVAVYEHWGFRPYQRTECDDQGNPFPIIKMRLLR